MQQMVICGLLGFARVLKAGHSGFMGYGDLWGFIFTWSIYNKSMLGFMGIYGDLFIINEPGENKSP